MKTITVFCSSKNNLSDVYIDQTKYIINKLDHSKFIVAYGSGSGGLMGVVRKTWLDKSGEIITSNLAKWAEPDIIDTHVFDNLTDRQRKLVEVGDGYLVLPGGFGTQFELLDVIVKNYVEKTNKPIFIFNLNGMFDDFINHVYKMQIDGFVTETFEQLNIHVTCDPNHLIEKIDEHMS